MKVLTGNGLKYVFQTDNAISAVFSLLTRKLFAISRNTGLTEKIWVCSHKNDTKIAE